MLCTVFEEILQAARQNTAAVYPLISHLTKQKIKTNKACGAILKKKRRTYKRLSPVRLRHMDTGVMPVRQKLTVSSVWTMDAASDD